MQRKKSHLIRGLGMMRVANKDASDKNRLEVTLRKEVEKLRVD